MTALVGFMACAVQANKDIELNLQPRLCVLTSSEAQCDQRVVAQWRSVSNNPYSLCLYQQHQSQPLACWDQVALGTAELHQVLRQSTAFILKDQQQQVLSSQTYEVIVESQRFQRPRRNPWSFY